MSQSSPASISSRSGAVWHRLAFVLCAFLFLVAGSSKVLGSFTKPTGIIAPADALQVASEPRFKLELSTGLICGNDPVNRHDPLGLDYVWVEERKRGNSIHSATYNGYAYVDHVRWVPKWVDGPVTAPYLLRSLVKGGIRGTSDWGREKAELAEALYDLYEQIEADPIGFAAELGIDSPGDVFALLGIHSAYDGVSFVGEMYAGRFEGIYEGGERMLRIVDTARTDWVDPQRGPNYALEAAGYKSGPTVAQTLVGLLVRKAVKKKAPAFDWGYHLEHTLRVKRPAGMVNAHAHHILYKKGHGRRQQALVLEGQAILRRHGIDPIYGRENLVWAPMRVKEQHGPESLQKIVDRLKAVDAEGGGYSDIVEVLRALVPTCTI